MKIFMGGKDLSGRVETEGKRVTGSDTGYGRGENPRGPAEGMEICILQAYRRWGDSLESTTRGLLRNTYNFST